MACGAVNLHSKYYHCMVFREPPAVLNLASASHARSQRRQLIPLDYIWHSVLPARCKGNHHRQAKTYGTSHSALFVNSSQERTAGAELGLNHISVNLPGRHVGRLLGLWREVARTGNIHWDVQFRMGPGYWVSGFRHSGKQNMINMLVSVLLITPQKRGQYSGNVYRP